MTDKKEVEQYQVVMDWLKSLDFTHSISLQLPFCMKDPRLGLTKHRIGLFMEDFEKAIIYKKYKPNNKHRKDTNDWKRNFLDFVIFFENRNDSYNNYHCHILLSARKKNGELYTDEEIMNSLEYASDLFGEYVEKHFEPDTEDVYPDYECRQILPNDRIYGYDLKEFIKNNKITDIDRLDIGRNLLNITQKQRAIKPKTQTKNQEAKHAIQKELNTTAPLPKASDCLPKINKKPNKILQAFNKFCRSIGRFLGLWSPQDQQPINNGDS